MIQGIEVHNSGVGSSEFWGVELWHDVYCYPKAFDWALDHGLAVFANSDAHGARMGRPVTLLLVRERTKKGVIDAIRARRTVAWFEGMLWGRQELLSKMVSAMVDVKAVDGRLLIRNDSPVLLNAVLDLACTTPVSIGPYEEAKADLSQSSQELTITWANLWVNSRDNLRTTHILKP